MRIRQLKLRGWGPLDGAVQLDPERVGVLLVDTERERAELVAALAALLTGASADARGAGGTLEALIEARPGAGAAGPLLWRVSGTASAPAPAGGLAARFPGVGERRWRAAGDALPPWIVDAAALTRGAGTDALVAWLRRRVDSTTGARSVEEVEEALRIEVPAALATELAEIDARLAGLAAEQAALAPRVVRLARLRAAAAALEPVLAALRDPALRTRIAELERRLYEHRAGHRQVRALAREIALLEAVAPRSQGTELARLDIQLEEWRRVRAVKLAREEALADLALARARCDRALARRAWATALPARAAEAVGRLAGRIEEVTRAIGDAGAAMEAELARDGDSGAAVRRVAELCGRAGEVSAEERALVTSSLETTAEGATRTRQMSTELTGTQSRLERVRAVQSHLRVLVALLALGGVGLALAVHLSGWQRINGVDAGTLEGAGLVLAVFGAAICASAGAFVSQRRGALENMVTQIRAPLELEELRLNVLEHRVADVCRKYGYDGATSLAKDLDEYERLARRRDTAPYLAARAELARLRTEELAPLAAEAHHLMEVHGLPHEAPEPAAALKRAWSEIQAAAIGHQWRERVLALERSIAAERDEEHLALDQRLANLRRSLAGVGIAADPDRNPAAIAEEIAARRALTAENARLAEDELPRARTRLLARAELIALRRELRTLRRRTTAPAHAIELAPAAEPAELDLDPHSLDARTDPAGGALLDELVLTTRQLERVRGEAEALAAEVHETAARLCSEGPALRARRDELAGSLDRAQALAAAAESARAALDPARTLGRGPAARALNSGAIPRWTAFRPDLKGVRFEDDLALHAPAGATLDPDEDAALAQLSVRAAIAAGAGAGTAGRPAGVPLVLVEPFEGFDTRTVARLVAFTAACVAPHPQVLIVSRLRSRWEQVRWEAPAVFERLQLASL